MEGSFNRWLLFERFPGHDGLPGPRDARVRQPGSGRARLFHIGGRLNCVVLHIAEVAELFIDRPKGRRVDRAGRWRGQPSGDHLLEQNRCKIARPRDLMTDAGFLRDCPQRPGPPVDREETVDCADAILEILFAREEDAPDIPKLTHMSFYPSKHACLQLTS